MRELSNPDVEGIYESQVPADFRILVRLGCCCAVDRSEVKKLVREGMKDTDTFSLTQLVQKSIVAQPYLLKVN